MRIRLLFCGTCISLGVLLACAEGAGALPIDDFSTAQTTLVMLTPGTSSSQVSGAGILGGERDMFVTLDPGSALGSVTSLTVGGGGDLNHWQMFGSLGTSLIVWDGPDDAPAIDYTGLGGLDFTSSGSQDRLEIPLLFNNLSAPLVLTAYTDANNFSTATVALPGGVPPLTDLIVLYTDFVDAGPLGGANFTNIGAFSLFIDGSSIPALDVESAGISAIPEPAT